MKAVALTVAGSDSGGGAGIQADLKTFAAHGVYGASVLTLVTAQNTRGVAASHALPPELVVAQLQAVLDDFPVAVVKVGALGTAPVVRAVADVLRPTGLPLILDPVMFAKGGAALLDSDAVTALRTELLPLACLVTPNLPEAEALLGLAPGELHGKTGLEALRDRLREALPFPLLLKGGHGAGETVEDELWLPNAAPLVLTAPRRHTRHTHGTGCTLSSAVAANLALGHALPEAVRHAHTYVQAALGHAPGLGSGHGPLEHFPRFVAQEMP
ncbi:bifunctional hydroxymethylpyrimidine kinase/phosphomethylpyrimidine kinase [Deinococcus hopiensis]|uniref:hydroxymethylpyrimidine kinase n=1 Tax=Deinococcus hopiensis KR-140 TaxID=695939 RepID=A0A1W1UFU6_9DEIO|nr:bifunctional hydroxymethylpyrimidine kinase/phosphomethylpyrimidine kinase [Deinococcus hopiensis]SMB79940.1 hydroxymethylpyrimidine/phosphomethylpyrimidine kinase [Deinococcus hopiensis KR-140]